MAPFYAEFLIEIHYSIRIRIRIRISMNMIQNIVPPRPPSAQFTMVPTTTSTLTTAMVITILFVLYLTFLLWVSAYDEKYVPNLRMLIDFITSGNTEEYMKNFELYARDVMKQTTLQKNGVPATQERSGVLRRTSNNITEGYRSDIESFTGSSVSNLDLLREWFTNAAKSVVSYGQGFLVKSYVQGNRLKVTKFM